MPEITTVSSAGNQIDLRARAHQEMIAGGFLPDFESDVLREVQSSKGTRGNLLGRQKSSNNDVRDLRSLLWSSIDNPESKDLDQIEYAERLADGNTRVIIAIADVDSLVGKGSATDRHAFTNTTSVYTGVVTYPMLPDDLSFNLTSLIADADRQAIVIDLVVDKTGLVIKSNVYLGIVRNHAKLDYKMVGQWLEDGGQPPDKIAAISGLSDQLLLQSQIKELMHNQRQQQGSLYLHTLEATTIAVNGQVLDLELVEDNPARDLIENFMISGNVAVSHFLESKQIPSIRRIVKTPERWDRIIEVAKSYGEVLPQQPDAPALAKFLLKRKDADPLRFPDLSLTIVKLLGRGEYVLEVPGQVDAGHFALAVHDYTHATAPNRRYPDLIMQRLVKAVIAGKPTPYTTDELNSIALHCTQQEDAANKVERTMRKVAAAVLLSKHIGEIFDGIVTGVTDGGTFARLIKPPAEGRVIHGEKGLDVGDQVKLKLVATDPEQAFIDFERL
jgi:VacB/RNase II family 3'-5' exoribonuclease